jgi:hypothetical protein
MIENRIQNAGPQQEASAAGVPTRLPSPCSAGWLPLLLVLLQKPWVTSNLSTQPHTSFQFAKLTPSLPVKKSLLRSAVSLSSFCKGYSHSAAEHLSRSFHSYDHLVLDKALDALVLGFARMKFTHGAIV